MEDNRTTEEHKERTNSSTNIGPYEDYCDNLLLSRVCQTSGIQNTIWFIFSPVFGPRILSHKMVLNHIHGSVYDIKCIVYVPLEFLGVC